MDMDGPALVAAMKNAKVSHETLCRRTGRSSPSVYGWKQNGVPGRMTERVLAALAEPSPANEDPCPISAREFREMFEASGLKQVSLARGVPVKPNTVASWMRKGVKASSALRVRYVLTHPEEFRHLVAPRLGRVAQPRAMSASQFRSLTSASGLLASEVADVMGVPSNAVRHWRQYGVNADVAAQARAVFGDATPAPPLGGEELRALMQREGITVETLAVLCGILDSRIAHWRSKGVPVRWSQAVIAHIAGDPSAPRVGGRKDPERVARKKRAKAAITTTAPIPGQEFARLLSATGLTQTQFGDLAGLSQVAVSRWRRSEVPAGYADAVLEVFRVRPEL